MYTIFRSPIVMFVIVPVWYILLNNRFPLARSPEGKKIHAELWMDNALTIVVYGGIAYLLGVQVLLYVQLPILVLF